MVAIEIQDVSKSFKVYFDKGQSLKERLLFKNRRRYEMREVLKHVSLQIEKGNSVGIVGENGCGKSTLLKLISRIIYPTEGRIRVSGRVSSLIELGAGFHPDMSGRENIYINSSIYGLSRKEIDERYGSILEFSELQDFIDNPVRTYSSGMYMRLAFSVAINVNADILLIDEILGVGDENFQLKCRRKLEELKEKGVTIVIVSHDANTIKSFCREAVWIKDGMVQSTGASGQVIEEYQRFMQDKRKC